MKIAILQFDPTLDSFGNNCTRAQATILSMNQVDLIVLPELWAIGFMNFDNFKSSAQKIDGLIVKSFQKMAHDKQTDIFIGSFIEESKGVLYNTSVYINKLGVILSTYRKIHLFTHKSREAEILSPGTNVSVFNSDFGPIGLATCYDLRFPEMFRLLQEKGANLFMVPAAWPNKRVEHFRLFCQSRAVENLCFMIAANCCGGNDNKKLGGHSMIVDPFGEIIAEGNDQESVIYADIDLQKTNYWRTNFSSLQDKKQISFWKQ